MSLFRIYAAALSKKKLVLVGVMIAVLTVGLGTRHYRSASLAERQKAAPAAAAPAAASVIGFIDTLKDGGQTIAISGWAVSRDGIRDATLILNGQTRIALRTGIGRPDVAAVHAQFPNAANSGFEGTATLEPRPAGVIRLEVEVTDGKGRKAILASRSLAPTDFRETWAAMAGQRPQVRDDVFYFLMATSNVAGGDAEGIASTFRPYESNTVKVGMRVQILYLRTTKGPAADYAFDADFSRLHKCGERTIAEDSLNSVIQYAVAQRLPVLFTLNGGFWADAACDAPQWDVNDFLEQDPQNDQWNEKGEVMPDDYLKNQAGSIDSPELGRGLTFNFYAEKNRRYKKRNLMQAAALIRDFSLKYPELFVGIALDPDVYLNPFYEGKQWYDYNPGTIRQFQEWLRGAGPYEAGGSGRRGPLAQYRRKNPLRLEEVNALSGRKFQRWEDVDPPREFPVRMTQFWKDPWVQEWEHFRRHLVAQHYNELSQWLGEAGFAKSFIFSSQGFMAPGPLIDPFPVYLNSPAKNYDTGGMSIEGSVPVNGHLGAILYGASAINQIRMEGAPSLFATFRQFDPDWAVVEYNTADLLEPARLADFGTAYKSLRDIANYGGRFVSPMAWNGSPGTVAGQPGFISYTSLRESPLEDAIKNFMISHANLPRRARLWTFGASAHAEPDGWTGGPGTTIGTAPGALTVRSNSPDGGSIESPGELAFRPRDYRALVLQTDAPPDTTRIAVHGQEADGKWVALIPQQTLSSAPSTRAGRLLEIPMTEAQFVRLRIAWAGNNPPAFAIRQIALYPR
jgi:hypothetical protein